MWGQSVSSAFVTDVPRSPASASPARCGEWTRTSSSRPTRAATSLSSSPLFIPNFSLPPERRHAPQRENPPRWDSRLADDQARGVEPKGPLGREEDDRDRIALNYPLTPPEFVIGLRFPPGAVGSWVHIFNSRLVASCANPCRSLFVMLHSE
jgi:hypothetical protein